MKSLVIHNIAISYQSVPAISNFTMELHYGRCVALLGPNGAGKSSLLKAIAGIIPLNSGRIEINDHKAKKKSCVAYLSQKESVDWDFPITVRKMIAMGRFPMTGGWKTFCKRDENIVNEAIEITQLARLADRPIHALSGGEQQRAFFARAYAQQADIFLLDEPFIGLDTNSQNDFRKILRTMADAGKLLVVSHHDLNSVPEIFDEVVMLNRKLIAYGNMADVFTAKNIELTYKRGLFTTS